MKPAPKKAAGWAAIAVIVVGGFEGLRTVAYRDPIGVITACFGETRNIRMGDKFTREECNQMLEGRLVEFWRGAAACIPSLPDMPDTRQAAVVSLAYNIGVGGLCKSSIARKLNAGDTQGACDAFLLYNRAGGIVFPGLTKRRKQERDLCLRS